MEGSKSPYRSIGGKWEINAGKKCRKRRGGGGFEAARLTVVYFYFRKILYKQIFAALKVWNFILILNRIFDHLREESQLNHCNWLWLFLVNLWNNLACPCLRPVPYSHVYNVRTKLQNLTCNVKIRICCLVQISYEKNGSKWQNICLNIITLSIFFIIRCNIGKK